MRKNELKRKIAEPNEQKECDEHVFFWTSYTIIDMVDGSLKKMGEENHNCLYYPKCGEKL